ncbi:MAG: tRNA pseudouridine(38-40) synthase TruA [Chloroflexota bacterium]
MVEYDGTDFHGSQVQPGLRTVQGTLLDALLCITQEHIGLEFAGRTDAGVHALGQVVSFATAFRHGPVVLQRGLNAVLPRDVAVRGAEEVDASFHARRSARERWYRYTVQVGPVPQPLLQRTTWFFPRPLDVERMTAAARYLLGVHDFIAFGNVPGGRGSSIRQMTHASACQEGDRLVHIDVKATAFLKHMARSISGLLLRTGTGEVAPEEVARVLAERDRHAAGPVAPARGLCLMGVSYARGT